MASKFCSCTSVAISYGSIRGASEFNFEGSYSSSIELYQLGAELQPVIFTMKQKLRFEMELPKLYESKIKFQEC